ncbi:nicotinate-nucleotide--dimethylbenzimidazole phosphoribosyltransferase, partial [Bombilactobacillus mellifer]|uniref:nicotinate-nucleotide--dimethylbenzimidazole phosphoribosyltransferase n=1 Tax=Bombilactobacillus mellifer TaxID=1218492 RepID=UPI0023F423C6
RPTVLDYVIPTHISHEQGSKLVLQALGLKPYIDLEMCVGEGSGAMMILPWLDGLQTILQQMNTQTDMDFTYFP